MKAVNTSAGSKKPFKFGRSKKPKPARARGSILFTLRGRLLIVFLGVVLVPLAVQAYLTNRSTQTALTDAARETLLTSARQTATDVDNFLRTYWYAVDDESELPEFRQYLGLPVSIRSGTEAERKAAETLQTLKSKQYVSTYYLLDFDGNVLLSTSHRKPEEFPDYLTLQNVDPYAFNLMLTTGYPFISPVMFAGHKASASLYFAARITTPAKEPLGLVIAQVDAYGVQAVLEKDTGLGGANSFPVLFDDNHFRIGHGATPQLLYKYVVPIPDETFDHLKSLGRLPDLTLPDLTTDNPDLEEGLTTSTNEQPYLDARSIGDTDEIYSAASTSLATRSWTLVYAKPQSAFLAPVLAQRQNSLIFVAFIAAVTFMFAIGFSQLLTRPITMLSKMAQKVAEGDYYAQAPESRDEIGMLAKTFNTMTTELRRTLEGLEHRVAERTAELARTSQQANKRARQLETVAEVAHAIASVQDPDLLLYQVTHLISERFSFYHVGIFLLDQKGEYAVLRAANSEGGQRMLARNHRLKVGQIGIVGYVSAHGEPRIALDVGTDAVFFDNPDLPYTRSEMALPLKVGIRVIGALDVQSMEQSAFSEEDVAVLSTLADQVAIAIENVRLFAETRTALTELQTLHRQYLQHEWTQASADLGKAGYLFRKGKLSPISQETVPDDWSVVESGEPTVVVTADQPDSDQSGSALVTPIIVRGQIIGKLNLAESDGKRSWSVDDINLVKSVADQVGQALENARLLEMSQRRAEREHLVAEITTKLRASNDPQEILQTAARELRQALHARRAQFIVQPSIQTGDTKSSALSNGLSAASAPDETAEN